MARNTRNIWSPASKRDLQDIWLHFAQIASPNVADALLREIHTAGGFISENPLGWQTHDELLPGVRIVPVHPYAIFYRVTSNVPQVLRVLHQGRTYGTALGIKRNSE